MHLQHAKKILNENLFIQKGSNEILRVWLIKNIPHFSVDLKDDWDDPAHWGILLADLVNFISKSYNKKTDRNINTTKDRILKAMHVELDNPTFKGNE